MVVRKMKEKCKDAARMRREKERAEFNELSKLLPLPSSTTSQLDKASIIRLTSSYLRMRSAFPEGLGANWGTRKAPASSNCNACVASSSAAAAEQAPAFDNEAERRHQVDDERNSRHHQQQQLAPRARCSGPGEHQRHQPNPQTIKELGSLILQTLDGFVFALHRDGKIMYISETASVLLGLPQIDLTGSTIFDYVHPADHNDLLVMWNLGDADKQEIERQASGKLAPLADGQPEHFELGRSFSLRMKCILPKRNAGLIKNGYKSIHCTGYLKVRRAQRQPADKAACGLDWDSYALVAVGHSLLPTASTEIKLNRNSFMFRANLDMRVFYMEATAIYSLGHQQVDLAGQSMYQLIHLADSQQLEEAHKLLLSKGQVVSKYFRMMRRDAGYVWVQMQASLINNPRSMPRPLHIVGICNIIGDNHADQSRLLLEEPVIAAPQQDDTCRIGSVQAIQTEHASSQRRKVMKTHSGSNSLLTIKEHTKLVSGNYKRAAAAAIAAAAAVAPAGPRRKEKSSLPVKRARHHGPANRCRLMDENDRDRLLQTQPSMIEEGALSIDRHYGQFMGLMRRPSDDTCSLASSSASASASSSATTISTNNVAPTIMPCPPPSVSSCSSSSSNCSSSSLLTPRPTNAGPLYMPERFYQTRPTRPSDSIEPFAQIDSGVLPFCQQSQLQEGYSLAVDTQHGSDSNQVYSDHAQYQNSNYWPSARDKISCHTSHGCVRLGADQQPSHAPAEQYYYSIGEQNTECDNQPTGYYQYNNSGASYNGLQHFSAPGGGFKPGMNIENSIQTTELQYNYPMSSQTNCEAVAMTAPVNVAPIVTPCFVGNNQSF